MGLYDNIMTPSPIKGMTHAGGNNITGNYFQNDKTGAMTGTSGFLSPAISAIGTGLNAWGGMKALGLAEDQFDFQKDSWEKNFAMMQDQYYRKLNDRRAGRAISGDMSHDEKQNIASHYDSGAQNVGAYPGSAPVGGPTQANANIANSNFNNIISNPAASAIPVNTISSAGMQGANVPYAQDSAYLDNTSVDQNGEVERTRKRRTNNGGVADSAVAGVAGNQGTIKPKIG